MKYNDILKELTDIESKIQGLTSIYVSLMNKDFKSVTFSLTMEKEKPEKTIIDTDGYDYMGLPKFMFQGIYLGASRETNTNIETTNFNIDPDIAMYVCQIEIQTLVEKRNQLVLLLNPKYKLPAK